MALERKEEWAVVEDKFDEGGWIKGSKGKNRKGKAGGKGTPTSERDRKRAVSETAAPPQPPALSNAAYQWRQRCQRRKPRSRRECRQYRSSPGPQEPWEHSRRAP